MKKTILITGATAGIGQATAIKFANNDYNIIITGRRAELLDKLSEKIKNTTKADVYSLCFDVRDNKEVIKAINSLPEKWKEIDILINNAGLAAGLNPIQEGTIEDWETMIDTNIKGLLYMSKAIIPLMIKREKGHIINIGSIAGKEAYLNGNVYCATKHAVEALTKSMRIDLLKHQIKVSSVCPGLTETEFSLVRFKGDKQRAKEVYNGFQPLLAEDVAETIYFVASRPAHVNIDDILIMPTAQANTSHLFKLI